MNLYDTERAQYQQYVTSSLTRFPAAPEVVHKATCATKNQIFRKQRTKFLPNKNQKFFSEIKLSNSP